jgi:uncharacterized repeat protein (TIGR03847 family)
MEWLQRKPNPRTPVAYVLYDAVRQIRTAPHNHIQRAKGPQQPPAGEYATGALARLIRNAWRAATVAHGAWHSEEHQVSGNRMSEFTFDLDAVQRLTAGAVGPKGQRVFYVQARRGNRLISLLAEKEQVRALAEAIDRLLENLAEKNPSLSTSDDMLIADMSLEQPLEPEFRAGQMGLGYDAERDLVVLVIQGIADNEESDEPLTARFSATRLQMRALSAHAAAVVASGRPICGNCGRPIDPSGHFCPQRNGHGPISVEQ